jgi:hypothetical protein
MEKVIVKGLYFGRWRFSWLADEMYASVIYACCPFGSFRYLGFRYLLLLPVHHW